MKHANSKSKAKLKLKMSCLWMVINKRINVDTLSNGLNFKARLLLLFTEYST